MKGTKRRSIVLSIVISLMVVMCFSMLYFFQSSKAVFADVTDSTYSDYTFELNNEGTSYKISAKNRQLTEAIIPAMYQDLPVTEVATNGFMSCSKLERVIIPETVTKLGSNAFMGCRNMKSLRGMANVTDIDNNAFALCTSLENLIIPSKVERLGSNIIRSVTNDVYVRNTEANMLAMNAQWKANSTAVAIYGNDLTCLPIYEGETVIGYKVDEFQLVDYSGQDVELICSYEESGQKYKLLEFADNSFAFSIFDSLTVVKDSDIAEDYSIKLGNMAFGGIEADYVTFDIDVTYDDCNSIFAGAYFTQVSFQNELPEIADYMFQYCENLTTIEIAGSVNNLGAATVSIGEHAFEGCYQIELLNISSNVSYVGSYAFNSWGTTEELQTICVNANAPQDGWSSTWYGDEMGANLNLEFNKITVFLLKEGGTGGTNYVEVSYGKPMTEATAPTRDNYKFMGYYTEANGQGVQYYDKDMNSVQNSELKEPTILYASWESADITVALDQQGGNGGTENIYPSYGQNMPSGAIAPEREGYTFGGYYDQENGAGKKYYSAEMLSVNEWDKSEDATLYAYWIPNSYTVTFNKNEGVGGSDYANCYFDKPITAVVTKPERTGYVFGGYYAEDGTQYYDETMNNVHNWDKADNGVLYAKWTAIVYAITYQNIQGGTNPSTNPTTYTIESETIVFAAPTDRAGYDGTWNFSSITHGSTGDKVITAVWTVVIYNIAYENLQGGVNPSTNPTTYTVESETIVFAAPTGRAGYNGSWNPSSIPSGSTGDKVITAVWAPIIYSIRYENLMGGTNPSTNPTYYTAANDEIVFAAPTGRAGYNGSWDVSTIPHGSTGDKVITAVWTPIEYHITYTNLQDGVTPSTNPTSYTIESATTVFVNPTGRTGYNGHWNISSILKGSTGNMVIEAVWTPIEYHITYTNLQGGVNPSQNPATYTIESATIVFAAPTGRSGYRGSWNPNSIPHGSYGDKTITAVWALYDYSITYQVDDWKGNTNPNRNTYDVNTSVVFEPLKATGYTFSWAPSEIKPGTTGPITVVGTWTPDRYKIDVENTSFQITANSAQNAINLPLYYIYGEGLDLTQFNPYFPSATYLSFEAFYDLDGNLITEIPKNVIGDCRIKAKWRINYNKISVSSNHTVTHDDYDKNDYVLCGFTNLNINSLRLIGIDRVVFQIKFDYKIIDQGYQQVRLYSPSTGKTLWDLKLDANNKDHYIEYYTGYLVFNLSDIGQTNDWQLQFGSSGSFGNKWAWQNLQISVQFIGVTGTIEDMLT